MIALLKNVFLDEIKIFERSHFIRLCQQIQHFQQRIRSQIKQILVAYGHCINPYDKNKRKNNWEQFFKFIHFKTIKVSNIEV